jgi:DNA-binding CsgD family transcriptional regulator
MLVTQGATNKQFARELGISRRTVESHLYTAYRQLDVPNRTAATAAVRRNA